MTSPESLAPAQGALKNLDLTGIDWVIVGGESGAGARPMHPDHARSLRDQCQAAGVPFLFKQWGEWRDGSGGSPTAHTVLLNGSHGCGHPDSWATWDEKALWQSLNPVMMTKVGKERAGRLLDGRTWDEYPEVRP